MPQRQLVGTKIREQRMERRMKQADLAERVGISASYLNLIEHNRRRIAGKLLSDIAQALDVDPALLTERTENAVIDQLHALAAAVPEAKAEVARVDDFASRFPGWSALIVALQRQVDHAEGRVETLLDRLAHDPQLATSLHEVISVATSIRSTASILVNDDQLDGEWLRRFHSNIHKDSLRMAEASRTLVTFLETPDADVSVLSPQEEVDNWLEQVRFVLPELEHADTIEPPAGIRTPAAKALLAEFSDAYRQDAVALPMEVFAAAAVEADYDPVTLANRFSKPLDLILRRLAGLPLGQGHPEFGLLICDAAGAILRLKPIDGFAPNRASALCPLWPVFAALSQPNVPLRPIVSMPGDQAVRFQCYAVAVPVGDVTYGQPARHHATMVVRATSEAEDDGLPVGPTCRICPRADCTARREPSILG